MQFSQIPTLLKLAFAALGGKNPIPVASQLPGNINGASYTDGFPPATRTALVAGGKPPAGLDVNGVLFDISSNVRWMNAGGPFPFSSDFAGDANVGGYPQGAEIAAADLEGTWISLNDSNTDNPDTGAGTKWVPGRAYGATPVTGLTNANVTLTPAQAAKNRITLAGTLTGNVQIIFPTWLRDWTVVNNTMGAFTVTAKTAAGTGVALPAGQTKITGDGTNIVQPAENIAPATASNQAAQFGQVNPGRYLGTQVITASGTFTAMAGTNSVNVRGWSGGAGAGGSTATGPSGGGGGAGAYFEGVFPYTGPVACTVGNGGNGGNGGASPTAGTAGGSTSYGAFASATGGSPGASNISSAGGVGGIATTATGYLAVNGQMGAAGPGVSGGDGGNSFGAPGGRGHNGNGDLGSAPGGGGGGGGSSGSGGGGAGRPGLIIVAQYA